MIQRVDAFFFSKETEQQRMKRLREFIAEYPAHIDDERLPLMLNAYNEFIQSNRLAYPFGGGRMAQPQWVLDYFAVFDAITELKALEGKRVDTATLPSREAASGRRSQAAQT